MVYFFSIFQLNSHSIAEIIEQGPHWSQGSWIAHCSPLVPDVSAIQPFTDLITLGLGCPDLPVCQPHNQRSVNWPGQTGHGAGLDELVADDLLGAPVLPDLVDEHNVVGLTHGQLGTVGTELQA